MDDFKLNIRPVVRLERPKKSYVLLILYTHTIYDSAIIVTHTLGLRGYDTMRKFNVDYKASRT